MEDNNLSKTSKENVDELDIEKDHFIHIAKHILLDYVEEYLNWSKHFPSIDTLVRLI